MAYIMEIFGIRDRYLLAALVIVLLFVVIVFFTRRRGTPSVEVKLLNHEEAARYIDDMDTAERAFLDHPEQSAAGARGIIEEVMRRKGFPDRVDGDQRVRDLAAHDKQAASSLKAANADLRAAKSGDTEHLRLAVQRYRDVLYRLLQTEHSPTTATPPPDPVTTDTTVG